MIDFQQEDRTQQRVIGAAATFAYAALVLLLLLLVRFTLAEPPDTGEGLMINFGNVTEAAPGEDLAMNDEAADAPQQTQAPSEAQPDEQEQMTQQTDEDVPVVKEEKKPEKKPKKEQVQAKPQPKPQQPAEKPRAAKAPEPGRAIRAIWPERRKAVTRGPERERTAIRPVFRAVRWSAVCRVPTTVRKIRDAS